MNGLLSTTKWYIEVPKRILASVDVSLCMEPPPAAVCEPRRGSHKPVPCANPDGVRTNLCIWLNAENNVHVPRLARYLPNVLQ